MPAKGYSPEERERIVAHICEQLAVPRSLAKICAEDEGMPSASTVCHWQVQEPLIQQRLERAREAGATTLLEEIVEIADQPAGDVYIAYDAKGKPYAKIDGDAIQRSRLRVYARERYAQLIAPKMYGQKLDVTSGGEKLPAPAAAQDSRLDALILLAAHRKALGPPQGELIEGEAVEVDPLADIFE